jgi:hypothetical protein
MAGEEGGIGAGVPGQGKLGRVYNLLIFVIVVTAK